MRRFHALAAAAALLSIAAGAWAQSAPAAPRGNSVYERLDPTRLADALAQMGIVNLLTIYADELEAVSPNDAKYVQASIAVVKARSLLNNPPAYLAEMDKAVAKFREVVAAAAKPADNVALLRSYRYRLRLADVSASLAVAPFVERMLFLQAGPEDRKIVADHTVESVKLVDELLRGVKEKLIELNSDTTARMVIGNELEEFQTMLQYKAGFIYLNRGLALDEPREKMACLRNAITVMDKFASDTEDEFSVKYEGMLLTGRCCRELKEWQRAIDLLKAAGAKEADAPTRLSAQFELGRCLIEKGDFEVARTHIEAFHKVAMDILGPSRAVSADVQYAFLKNALYEAWSESLSKTDPAKAGEMSALAQKAQMEFVNAHPDEAAAFYEMISARFTGEPSDKQDSMVIVAIVNRDLGKYPEGTPQRAEAEKKALETLQIVLNRTDPASKEVHPQAMYTMAVIYSKLLQNAYAGQLFYEIADKHSDYPLAFNSILNSAISYSNILQDRIERNMTVPRQFREDLVRSLEKMFSRKDWAQNAKAQPWMFSLAWQYDKLADLEATATADDGAESPAPAAAGSPRALYLEKATNAYERVAPDQPEYMEARFMALQTRKELLAGLADKAAQRAAAAELYAAAKKFLADAAQATAAAKTAKKENDVKQLRGWSADSDVLLATLNYDYLDLKAQARTQLDDIAKNWAETNALKQSAQLLIQYDLLEGRTEEAATRVKQFREKYADEAAGLIRMVIAQLQDQIKQLRYDPRRTSALAGYRKAYFEFANVLFDDNRKSNPAGGADQLYPYEQMLADATLEMGQALRDENRSDEADKKFAAAQAVFEKCKALDDRKRDDMSRKLDARFAQQMQAAQSKDIAADAIQMLAEDLLAKDLPACGVVPRNMSSAVMVNLCLASLKKEDTPANVTALQRAVLTCYQNLLKTLKKGLPVDPVNLWGLARSYRLGRKYSDALTCYRTLIGGIDKDKDIGDYWQAELEYAQTGLEGVATFPNTADQISRLVNRIRQLRSEDANMGGLKTQFGAVEAQAQKVK